MLKSNEILYSAGKNDEMYSPAYLVKPILKYIPKDWVIWCCMDEKNSEYVKQISKTNKVIHSHINKGQDFFKYEPEESWDCIITNPCFTGKRKVFERALSFNKSFCILTTLTAMNDKYPCWSFYEQNKQMQLLKFDKRVHFIQPDGTINKKTTFQSGYICWNFLPKDFILEELIR